MELRSFIVLFNKNINEHGLNYEESSKIIKETTEENMKAPTNQFQLFLSIKNRKIEDRLFGIKDLMLIVNKLAHPTDQEGLVDALQRLDLIDLYKNKDWPNLHRKILEKFKDSLNKIKKSIETK